MAFFLRLSMANAATHEACVDVLAVGGTAGNLAGEPGSCAWLGQVEVHATEDWAVVAVPVFGVRAPEGDPNIVNIFPNPSLPRVPLHVNILASLRCPAISILLPKLGTRRVKGLHFNVPPIRVGGRASTHVYIKIELSQSLPIDVGVCVVSLVCLGVDGVPVV